MLKKQIRNCILYCGDCYEILKSLDVRADSVITDPPYGITDCHWDIKIELEGFWKLLDERTKNNANIVVFSAEPFTSELVVSKRDWFRYDIIWEKQVALRFLDCKLKPLKAHENILVFYKTGCSPKNKNNDNKTAYNPQKTPTKKCTRVQYNNQSEIYYGMKDGKRIYSTDSKYPRSVIMVDGDKYRYDSTKHEIHKHPTRKPEKLLEFLVNSYSNENELILDPFTGSGTTGVACVKAGRRFIGIEKEKKYFEMSCERIEQAYQSIDSMFPEFRPEQKLLQLE
jgi:site-specific DNA-methyltransferase (adenine-specific)